MTIKELKAWLSRARNIDAAIENLKKERQKALSSACGTSSGFGNERVQESKKNASERKFIAYADYAKLINDKIDEFYDCKQEILAAINKLDNPTYYALLTGYYVNCQTWEQVAENINYSDKWARTGLHNKALYCLSKII